MQTIRMSQIGICWALFFSLVGMTLGMMNGGIDMDNVDVEGGIGVDMSLNSCQVGTPGCFGFTQSLDVVSPCCECRDKDNLNPYNCPDIFQGEAPPAGWMTVKWSEWDGKDAFLNSDSPVVIPCGLEIELDVSPPPLKGLEVRGAMFVTNAPGVDILLSTDYLYVCGAFRVGERTKKFHRDAYFELELTGTSSLEVGGVNFGQKALIVDGGMINIKSGYCGTPTWTQLAETAFPGDTHLKTRMNVKGRWREGSELVLTATGYNRDETEIVTAVDYLPENNTIVLAEPLEFDHIAYENMRAEVGTLSSNIMIRGETGCYSADGNNQYKCGHFMIHRTPYGSICGAEFKHMGQQTTLGRYPIHTHLAGDAPDIYIGYNRLHRLLHRCVVIHATSYVTVEWNVAFRTQGHCFMNEDGAEIEILFRKNMGVTALKPSPAWSCPSGIVGKTCLAACSLGILGHGSVCGSRFDHNANIFWLGNTRNHAIGNVAVGAETANFRYEARYVSGLSALIVDEVEKVSPLPKGSFGTFRDNIAHSAIAGLQVYPQFEIEAQEFDARVERFISWRNSQYGLRIMAASKYWEISKSDIVGNPVNIALMDNVVARITDTTIRKDPLNPNGCSDGFCTAIQNSKTTQSLRLDSFTSNYLRVKWQDPGPCGTRHVLGNVCLPPSDPECVVSTQVLEYGNSSYMFFPLNKNFYDSKEHCEDLGGYLARVDSEEEQSFITQVTVSSTMYTDDVFGIWIDGKRPSGSNGAWTFSDGSTSNSDTFFNWCSSQPDKDSEPGAWASSCPVGGCSHFCVDIYVPRGYPFLSTKPEWKDAGFKEVGCWNDKGCDLRQAFLCEFDKSDISAEGLKSLYSNYDIDIAKPVQNEVTSTLFCGDFDLPSIDKGGTQAPIPSSCSFPSGAFKTGDMDYDGVLSILDLFKMIRALLNLEQLDECQTYSADKFGKEGFNAVDLAGWTKVILCASIVPGEILDQLICNAYQ